MRQEADETLARRAAHDREAFAELYRRYLNRVYRYVLARVNHVQDAQDLTTQTFIAALESIQYFRGQGAFAAWLLGIARRKAVDYFRGTRHTQPLEDAEFIAEGDATPEEALLRQLQVEQVMACIGRLQGDRAEALALRLFGGLSSAQPQFAAALEARLRSHRQPKGVSIMRSNTLNLNRFAVAVAALIVVIVATLTVPPLRTLAQEIINFLFQPATSDTQTYATPIVYDTEPTPVSAAIYSTSLTIEEAEAQAGFDVLVPSYMPEGYLLTSVTYDPVMHSVALFYVRNGIGLGLVQTPAAYAEVLEVGASANILTVQVGEATGQYVEGWWVANAEQSDDSVSISGQTWDSDLPFQQLGWQQSEIAFWMYSPLGQNSDLSLDEWITIAESLQ